MHVWKMKIRDITTTTTTTTTTANNYNRKLENIAYNINSDGDSQQLIIIRKTDNK